MYYHFQNLNDNPRHKRLFYFRGTIGYSYEKKCLSYELCSGPACRFIISPKDEGENKTLFALGLIFFTLYLTLPIAGLPFLRPGREYGFYWYEWTLWAFFGADPMSSSTKDPWYYRIVIHPLDILFGKTLFFEKEKYANSSPVEFEFRNSKYTMDSIRICESFWFKTRVPFALWHLAKTRMNLDIKSPPKYSGKGENSWDCGDDATYGTCQAYTGSKPSYLPGAQDQIFEHCCRVYCEGVLNNIKKYGRASGDELPQDYSNFKYIGPKRDPNPASQDMPSLPAT